MVQVLCLFFSWKKSKLSYMIIIFYDNFALFKKSKLTYKLILSKQKQDSDWILFWCLHLFIRSGLLSFWVRRLTSWSWTQKSRNDVHFNKHPHDSFRVLCVVCLLWFVSDRFSSYPDFSEIAFPVQFLIRLVWLGSMLASYPFLRRVFLGFHSP